MSTRQIRGLGLIPDGFTTRWNATGSVEGVGWLEAWRATLVEAMEALQKTVEMKVRRKRPQEGQS